MFSDGIIPLIESGVINCSKKTLLPGKIVTSFVLGSQRLFEYIDNNPLIEMRTSDFVNDPFTISRNDNMVAINSSVQVDLTGQVCADSIGYNFYSGFGGQVDFIRGASRSKGGKPVIAFQSTVKNGAFSRIVTHLDEGAGVTTSRGDVHFIVTEYGIADLHGLSIRERANALINIAHPKFREELEKFAKTKKYI
jgi:acetyl-CoA hydrolase